MTQVILTQEQVRAFQAVADKQAIMEVYTRYSRAVDRVDKELLKTVFHPGGYEEHGGIYAGSSEGFVEFIIPVLAEMGNCTHLIGNVFIDLQDDVAFCEAPAICFQRVFDDNGDPYDAWLGVRYLDRMEKRDGEWRVARRKCVYDWNRDVTYQETWFKGLLGKIAKDGFILGRTDESDPSYEVFGGSFDVPAKA